MNFKGDMMVNHLRVEGQDMFLVSWELTLMYGRLLETFHPVLGTWVQQHHTRVRNLGTAASHPC